MPHVFFLLTAPTAEVRRVMLRNECRHYASTEGSRTTQHGLHAQDKFARRERFRHVVVGADLQAEDAVGLLAEGGQHDDRQGAVGRPQAPAASAVS